MSIRGEKYVENNVIRNSGVLGYPDSTAIRNMRIGHGFGAVDVVLLPRSGPHRMVLVEAKRIASPEAVSKVIGQLLLYYTAAQQIGESGLELIRRFAERRAKLARRLEPKSLKMLTGGVSPPSAAYDQLKQGPKLISQQLALFIALNGEPHRALQTTLNNLSLQHGLEIGVAAVLKRDQITVWRPERRVQPL